MSISTLWSRAISLERPFQANGIVMILFLSFSACVTGGPSCIRVSTAHDALCSRL